MVQPIRSPGNPGTAVVSIGHLTPWPENPGYRTKVWDKTHTSIRYGCVWDIAICGRLFVKFRFYAKPKLLSKYGISTQKAERAKKFDIRCTPWFGTSRFQGYPLAIPPHNIVVGEGCSGLEGGRCVCLHVFFCYTGFTFLVRISVRQSVPLSVCSVSGFVSSL